MPHGGDGCGCGGGTPEVQIPTQPVAADDADTQSSSEQVKEEKLSFTTEELKAMTYYLYSEVPFMKGYLNNELKHFVRGTNACLKFRCHASKATTNLRRGSVDFVCDRP